MPYLLLRILGALATIGGLWTLAVRLRLLPAEVPPTWEWGRGRRGIYLVFYWLAYPFWNILLLLFGNVALHKRVNLLQPFNASLLFARVAGIDSIAPETDYHILYSHKDGFHPPIVGRIAGGFPHDEADAVLRLNTELTHTIHPRHVLMECSEHLWSKETDVLCNPYAIIGSPTHNEFSRRIMQALADSTMQQRLLWQGQNQYMLTSGDLPGHSKVAYVRKIHDPNDVSFAPDALPTDRNTASLKDYAVFMRYEYHEIITEKLFFSDAAAAETVLLLAGCKMAGQMGLTQWLSDPKNLAYLDRQYSGKYFCIILKIDYEFVRGGIPIIKNVVKVADDLITLKNS